MLKYYIARLVLWAVTIVQARRNSDTELVTKVLTNHSNLISNSSRSSNTDDLMW